MDKVKFLESIKAIGVCEDEVARRELLTQLQDEVAADYTRFSELETTNTQLTTDNETLRQANMKLFLRVGSQATQQTTPQDEPETKLEYKNLFNEKGEIKR